MNSVWLLWYICVVCVSDGCSVNVLLSCVVVVVLIVSGLCSDVYVGFVYGMMMFRLLVVLCWIMNMKCWLVLIFVNMSCGVMSIVFVLVVVILRNCWWDSVMVIFVGNWVK